MRTGGDHPLTITKRALNEHPLVQGMQDLNGFLPGHGSAFAVHHGQDGPKAALAFHQGLARKPESGLADFPHDRDFDQGADGRRFGLNKLKQKRLGARARVDIRAQGEDPRLEGTTLEGNGKSLGLAQNGCHFRRNADPDPTRRTRQQGQDRHAALQHRAQVRAARRDLPGEGGAQEGLLDAGVQGGDRGVHGADPRTKLANIRNRFVKGLLRGKAPVAQRLAALHGLTGEGQASGKRLPVGQELAPLILDQGSVQARDHRSRRYAVPLLEGDLDDPPIEFEC